MLLEYKSYTGTGNGTRGNIRTAFTERFTVYNDSVSPKIYNTATIYIDIFFRQSSYSIVKQVFFI